MSGEITVTPGQTFTNEDVTPTRLNNLGAPTMAVDAEAITTRELNIPEIIPNLTPVRKEQLFRNAALQRDTWRDLSGVTCTADTRTDNAAGWYVLASGAAPTYAEAAFTETLSYLERGAKITGATSVTTVLFGQFVRADIARYLKAAGSMTISFALENQTGASLSTAVVSVQPATQTNSGTTVTEATTGTVDTVADGAAAFVDVTITTSSITNLENGFYLAVKFPSGSLDGSGKHVIVSGFRLQAGSSASAWEVPRDPQPHGVQVRHNLDASAAPLVTNDASQGYSVGSKWRVTATGQFYVCTDPTLDNAAWQKLAVNNEVYSLFLNTQTAGTDGGAISTTAAAYTWTTAIIEDSNYAYLDTGTLKLGTAGPYRLRGLATGYRCGGCRLIPYGKTTTSVQARYVERLEFSAPGADQRTGLMPMDFLLRCVADDDAPTIYVDASSSRATDGRGVATSLGSEPEVYGILEVSYLPESHVFADLVFVSNVYTTNQDVSDSAGTTSVTPRAYDSLLIGQTDASENGVWQYFSEGWEVPPEQYDPGANGYDNLAVLHNKTGDVYVQLNTVSTTGTDDQVWVKARGYDLTYLSS